MNPLAIVFVILGVWLASIGFRDKQGNLFAAFTGKDINGAIASGASFDASGVGAAAGSTLGQIGTLAGSTLAKTDSPVAPIGKGYR